VFSRKASKPQSRIDSLVGGGTSIEGDITFSGGLRIDGQIRGNVRATDDQSSTLVVSEHARIEGEVSVSHVVINGTVIGPVRSGGFLELQAKARVTGDVEYNSIEMHLGAVVQGRLIHQGAPTKSVELKLASSAN
jgi:cytoskeletal protein CcmA (bactofilin family)